MQFNFSTIDKPKCTYYEEENVNFPYSQTYGVRQISDLGGEQPTSCNTISLKIHPGAYSEIKAGTVPQRMAIIMIVPGLGFMTALRVLGWGFGPGVFFCLGIKPIRIVVLPKRDKMF